MKPSTDHRAEWLLTALLFVIIANTARSGDFSGGLEVALEGDTASTNRGKFGWAANWDTVCTDSCELTVAPRIYRQFSSSVDYWLYDDVTDPNSTYYSSSVASVVQATPTGQYYASASGTDSRSAPGSSCSGSLVLTNGGPQWYISWNGGETTEANCGCEPSCSWWSYVWSPVTPDIECLSRSSERVTRIMDEGNSMGEEVETYSYSDEYGTAELLSPDGLDYPGTWNDTSGAASAIAGDETSAVIQKGKYRFKVIAEKDKRFRIHYVEHYSGAGFYTNSEGSVEGVGTGSTQYIPGPEYAPPHTNILVGGCTNIVGASKWVTLGCASFVNEDGSDGCGGGQGGSSGGCRACSGSPGSVQSCPLPMRASVSLWAGSYGDSHNKLVLASPSPSSSLASPSGLEFFGNTKDVEIIRSSGALRQVRGAEGLADITTNSATSYSIRLYTSHGAPSGGLYDVTGYTPFSTTTISQGTSTNQLVVTVDNGTTSEYVYDWSAADQGWTLTSGGGARKQSIAWNSGALARTNTIKDGANQVVSRTIEYFTEFGALGQQRIKKIVDPDGAALTSQWFYYDNAGADGTNYGELKLEIEPTGFWKRNEYDTNNRVVKEISQFLNAATNAAENLCRVVEYDYSPVASNSSCTLRVEKLLGQEISRQYTLYYGPQTIAVQCQTAGASWTNADNLFTTNQVYAAGDFVGQVKTITNPDGTMQFYEYETNSTQKTTTVYSGQPGPYGTNIVDGTKSVTVVSITGQAVSREVFDIASGMKTASETHSYDALGRLTGTTYLDGTSTSATYACCGMETSTDRDGTVTSYSYDALKRQTASTRNGITTTNALDAAGRLLATIRIGTDSSTITNSGTAFDLAGRITRATNALGGVTIYTNTFDGSGQTIKTNTAPGGGTRVEIYYQDGSLQKTLGTAAFPVRYEYGVEMDGGVYRAYTKEIKLNASGGDTSEWTKTYTDLLGRGYKTVYAAASGSPASQSYYNNAGQLWKQVDPDGVTTLHQYNAKGEAEYTAVDLNTNGAIDFSGTDRITRTVTVVTNDRGYDLRRTFTYAWATDSANTSLLVSARDMAVNSPQSWNTLWNNGQPVTSHQQTSYPGSGYRNVTATAPDGSYTFSTYLYGQLQSVTRYDSLNSQLSALNYSYDPHGRAQFLTDARNGTTTNWFNNADQVSGTKTPLPGTGAAAQVTTNYFDTTGRLWKTTQADNTSVTNEYFLTGLLKKTYGSRTYPVEYTYDAQGRMATWQNFTAGTGTATTTWQYDVYRGWLTNKVYADGKGTIYSNTPAGRLVLRKWARGVNTSYSYNTAGDLSGADYSDSTPDVTYSYDRRGRQTTMAAGGVTTTKTYNDAGLLATESYSGGPLNGLSVTNGYDEFLRRTNLATLNGSTTLTRAAYAYDYASRLDTVTDLIPAIPHSAQYTYLANSPLVGQITFATNGTTVMTTIKGYDALNRLTNIVSSGAGFQPVSFAYQYNSANQRTAITNTDESRWVYTYDSLGQVTGGKKYWSDGTPVAGQHFEYAFDTIGNRQSTKAGGDNGGASLRPASNAVNTLNQYTSREVPGYVNSLGTAHSNTTVTLWSDTGLYAPTLRKGDYFRGELLVNNSTGAVWLTLTNVAVLNDGSNPDVVTNTTGNVLLAKTPQAYTYDFDGNLMSDGVWTNTWNGENRRTVIQSRSDASSLSKSKVEWTHLPDGRWIERIVSTNNGTAYYPSFTNRYIWDGQVLLAVLNHTNGLELSFMRGLDLSGTPQGAGGVGGLLLVTHHSSPATRHFVANDGNGNVTALVNAASGTESARYEYGPFAEPIRMTGPMAKLNPIRFSAQYADDVAGDLKYLFREYAASEGRWLSRDSLGETGHSLFRSYDMRIGKNPTELALSIIEASQLAPPNLYSFVDNRPALRIDLLGRAGCDNVCSDAVKEGLDVDERGLPDVSGVICCEGKKYSCLWRPTGQSGRLIDPLAQRIAGRCLIDHENVHHDHIDCPACTPWPTREPFRFPITEANGECEAYTKSVTCLQNGLRECNNDLTCKQQLAQEIITHVAMKKQYCGGSK